MYYGAIRLCRVKSYKQLCIEQYDDKILRIQFGFYSGSYSIIIPYSEILSVRKVKSSDYGCFSSLNECVCAGSLTLNANGTYCCEFREQMMIEIQLTEGWRHSCDVCGSMIFTVRVSTEDLDNLINHILHQNDEIDVIHFDGSRERGQGSKKKNETADLRVNVNEKRCEGSNQSVAVTVQSLEIEIGDGDIYTAVNTNDTDAV